MYIFNLWYVYYIYMYNYIHHNDNDHENNDNSKYYTFIVMYIQLYSIRIYSTGFFQLESSGAYIYIYIVCYLWDYFHGWNYYDVQVLQYTAIWHEHKSYHS